MASEFSRGAKIHPKRSLCWEIKYTFKIRITELYFEAIETNRDPKNSQILHLNVTYFCDKLYLLPNLFFQNTIHFRFCIKLEPHAVMDCLFFCFDIKKSIKFFTRKKQNQLKENVQHD